jgi:hypothetical protein
MSTYTQKALAAASALLLGVPTAALSHTNSIGYVGAGNGTVTFWYGNWHPGTTFTEGSMTLLGVNGTNYSANTVNWTLLQNTKPTGLVDGTNYFTSNGSALVPYGSNSQVSYTWQGVTFTGLAAGDYQFTYNPIAQPTANWAPMDSIINTSTVSLTSAIINNTCNTCQGTSAPTVTSTAPGSDIVTTTTTYGTRTVTGHPHRHVFGMDADGNQTETHYLDDAVTTIPTTTVTTTTTPVTITTWSDGSTTTTNGTPTTTSVTTDDNGGTTVVTQTNNIEWVKTRTYDIQRTAYSPSGAPTIVNTPNWTPTESSGKQKLNLHLVTGVTTPTTRAVTTTAVYTKVYTDGVTPTAVTNDTPVVTYETSSTYDEYHTYKDWYGRVDQLEVLDNISGAINGLLDHEPITNHKKRFRVFENTRFAQSYNADGYNASSTIIGGGFEYDLTKGWTAGAQYNDLYTEMLGVDSLSHLKRQHVGLFNSFHGRDIALVTNAGWSQDQYDYARTLEYQFGNWGKTDGNQWWVHNRLYFNNSGWFKPFLGYTISNIKRNAYSETGSPESARNVDAFNKTTHVGEVGLKLETRFGGKKHDVFGISVDGSYGTDSSYGVTASLDYKEVLFVEGSYGVADGVTTNSVAAKAKFRF